MGGLLLGPPQVSCHLLNRPKSFAGFFEFVLGGQNSPNSNESPCPHPGFRIDRLGRLSIMLQCLVMFPELRGDLPQVELGVTVVLIQFQDLLRFPASFRVELPGQEVRGIIQVLVDLIAQICLCLQLAQPFRFGLVVPSNLLFQRGYESLVLFICPSSKFVKRLSR